MRIPVIFVIGAPIPVLLITVITVKFDKVVGDDKPLKITVLIQLIIFLLLIVSSSRRRQSEATSLSG